MSAHVRCKLHAPVAPVDTLTDKYSYGVSAHITRSQDIREIANISLVRITRPIKNLSKTEKVLGQC